MEKDRMKDSFVLIVREKTTKAAYPRDPAVRRALRSLTMGAPERGEQTNSLALLDLDMMRFFLSTIGREVSSNAGGIFVVQLHDYGHPDRPSAT